MRLRLACHPGKQDERVIAQAVDSKHPAAPGLKGTILVLIPITRPRPIFVPDGAFCCPVDGDDLTHRYFHSESDPDFWPARSSCITDSLVREPLVHVHRPLAD